MTVSGLTSPSTTIITLFDNSSPRQSATVSIDCSGQPTPPPPSALAVLARELQLREQHVRRQVFAVHHHRRHAGITVIVTSGQTGATITQTGSSFTVTGLADTGSHHEYRRHRLGDTAAAAVGIRHVPDDRRDGRIGGRVRLLVERDGSSAPFAPRPPRRSPSSAEHRRTTEASRSPAPPERSRLRR